MFEPAGREQVRRWLIDLARDDPRITGAALVGSAARDQEDAWSDIDLAVRLQEGASPTAVADDWSAALRQRLDVVDQLDLWSDRTLFRVFLLADTLQVDLSFWPGPAFAARGGPFRLLFGAAGPPVAPAPFDAPNAVRMGWLYALHVRSSLARGRPWQAAHLIDGLRDRVVALACARHGLSVHDGRGVDGLPEPVLSRLGRTLVGSVQDDALGAAFGALAGMLLAEASQVDPALAARLQDPLRELVRLSRPDAGRDPRPPD